MKYYLGLKRQDFFLGQILGTAITSCLWYFRMFLKQHFHVDLEDLNTWLCPWGLPMLQVPFRGL